MTEITIPNSVTSIGNYAFAVCTGLTEITIPNSVTSIGNYAFAVCTGLTEIIIPNSVTSIGKEAFRGCTGLTEITIGNSVTTIDFSAFKDCTGLTTLNYNANSCSINSLWLDSCNNLEAVNIGDNVKVIPNYFIQGKSKVTSITIPNSVTSIGKEAFRGCTGLTEITIGNSVTTIDFSAFKDCTGLTTLNYNANSCSINSLWLDSCNNLEAVNIGDNVKVIPNYFIQGKSKVTSITIPNSVTAIRAYAFQNCTGLTEITIPNSVTGIGNYAFQNCTGLTTLNYNADSCSINSLWLDSCNNLEAVNIGDNVKVIPNYFIQGKSKVTSITIPNSVTSIGNRAFYSCTGLTGALNIPNSVTSIGDSAFYDCKFYGGSSLTIGNNLISIGRSAFAKCTGLATLNYNADSCGGSGFYYTEGPYYNPKYSSWLDGCYNLTTVNIGDNVKVIPNYFIQGKSKVTSITIPNSVTSIGARAFSGCTAIKYVVSKNTTPAPLSYSVFDNTNSSKMLYVPCGSVETYKSDWQNYFSTSNILGYNNIQEKICWGGYNVGVTYIGQNGNCYDTIKLYPYSPLHPNLISTYNASNTNATYTTLNASYEIYDDVPDIIAKGFQYKFYYKTSAPWSSVTATVDDTANKNYSATINKLYSDSTYSYRAIMVLNNGDTVFGETKTFTTLPFVQSLSAAPNYLSATIKAKFVKDSNLVKKGIIFQDSIVVVTTADSLVKAVTGLKLNTTYSYKAFAITSWGDTAYSQINNFTTKDITVLTYSAANVNQKIATLSAVIAFGDVPKDSVKIGFIFENSDTVFVNTTDGNFSYNMTGLSPQTKYTYRAFAKAYGKWYSGGNIMFTTLPLERQGDWYLINNEEDLHRFSSLVNNSIGSYDEANYKLTKNINLPKTQNNITPIGKYPTIPFKGTFDGANHIIYNVNIEKLQDSCQGLFAYAKNAEISNLGVADINITSRKFTGGMIAVAENSKITNCYVKSGMLRATSYSGGLVGYQSDGDNSIIQGCYNNCSVEGNNYIGGLLGYSYNGVVRNSYVAAPVIGHGDYGIGAIIGGSYDVLMYDVYFSTNATGQSKALGEVISKKKGTDVKAGEGKTDTEMKTAGFVTLLNNGMLTPVWVKDFTININDGYPILNWQSGTAATVKTDLATDITETSAVLHGSVIIDGEGVVSQGFFYKKASETDYTSVEVAGENISYKLTNLQNNTEYVYKAYASSENDTIFGEEMTFTTLKGVGIESVAATDRLSLYPNPTKDKVTVRGAKGDVMIINSNGQIVKTLRTPDVSNNPNKTVTIDVTDLASGVYYVKCGAITKKLIVK